ncbi:copper resistance protein CopD [Massilia sp. Root418]|uniref:copper resistance D family protein n=1 Tax=Massilia sp. Root418 TaxID=1736532 RepID=UPI0006FCBB95|nr:CopD family protein [Massilia sp. Root418]KQX01369.1 copper resistance protein CopD [Massilia sp. Root418]
MDAVSLLQTASAFLLNVGFAWLAGSWIARHWLRSNGANAGGVEPQLRRTDLAAAGMSTLGSVTALLAATAVMGDVGLREACPIFWMMLTSTDYGHAGSVTIAAMLAMLLIRGLGGTGRATTICASLALLLFVVTRASMGHAGEEGLLSGALAAEALHYAAIGLWTGAVLVSGWFALHDARIGTSATGAHDRYLELMSKAAMAAVIAIIATGAYSAWHRVGSAEHLQHTFYGKTLLLKVALVMLAVALGGYNKFIGLPAARRSNQGLRQVRTALRLESAVLLGAMLAASVLSTQQPPAAM